MEFMGNENKTENKNFKYNGDDFRFVKEYEDEKYGKIAKAISKDIENLKILYFQKEDKNLSLITDKKIIDYIYKKYDEIKSDIIISEDDMER